MGSPDHFIVLACQEEYGNVDLLDFFNWLELEDVEFVLLLLFHELHDFIANPIEAEPDYELRQRHLRICNLYYQSLKV